MSSLNRHRWIRGWERGQRTLKLWGNKEFHTHPDMRRSFIIQRLSINFRLGLAQPPRRLPEFTNMKDYLNLWHRELLKLGSLTVKSKITVMGERNQHLGPRWEFARIQVSVEPATQFEVIDTVPAKE